jgi:hypothetical protein
MLGKGMAYDGEDDDGADEGAEKIDGDIVAPNSNLV